jgi:hypothetical protein
VDAVRDYEVLRMELPNDNEVAESLFHAQVALKKSRGEEVYNMKFGGEVEEVSGHEQFRAAISLPGSSSQTLFLLKYNHFAIFSSNKILNFAGVSVVHFNTASDLQSKQISPFVDALCSRYPSINFLKVNDPTVDLLIPFE